VVGGDRYRIGESESALDRKWKGWLGDQKTDKHTGASFIKRRQGGGTGGKGTGVDHGWAEKEHRGGKYRSDLRSRRDEKHSTAGLSPRLKKGGREP